MFAEPTTHRWDLNTRLLLDLAKLEKALAANGYHLALGGSVLYQGYSNKDLDLFIYEHTPNESVSRETHVDRVINIFASFSIYLHLGNISDIKAAVRLVLKGETASPNWFDGKAIDVFLFTGV